MDITYSGTNLKVTNPIKSHIEDRLFKFEKYSSKIIESHVILKKQKYTFEAEITLLAKNLKAVGQAKSKENIYAAIDEAHMRVEKQLKKFRDKTKNSHKKTRRSKAEATYGSFAGEEEALSEELALPLIVKARKQKAKTMTADEASMRLMLAGDSFLIFKNAKTKSVNVIFVRKDGKHGLLDCS